MIENNKPSESHERQLLCNLEPSKDVLRFEPQLAGVIEPSVVNWVIVSFGQDFWADVFVHGDVHLEYSVDNRDISAFDFKYNNLPNIKMGVAASP